MLEGAMMRHFISSIALLCVVTSVSGKSSAASQAESNHSSSPAAAQAASNKTFAASIEAASIPVNVSIMIGALDRLADTGEYDITIPSTILVPTDEAWYKVMQSAGFERGTLQQLTTTAPEQQLWRSHALALLHDEALDEVLGSEQLNQTTVQQLTEGSQVTEDNHWQLLLLRGAALALLLYHEMPDVTLMSAHLTGGMSMPTSLEGAGTIGVRVDPTTGNISFLGFVDKTDPAASRNSSNYASVIYRDIPVVGSNGVVMHIVETVLEPPLEALAESAVGFALGRPSERETPSGPHVAVQPVVQGVEHGSVSAPPPARQGGGGGSTSP